MKLILLLEASSLVRDVQCPRPMGKASMTLPGQETEASSGCELPRPSGRDRSPLPAAGRGVNRRE